eukprot:134260-Alexandrium_andersonii.AAC.1
MPRPGRARVGVVLGGAGARGVPLPRCRRRCSSSPGAGRGGAGGRDPARAVLAGLEGSGDRRVPRAHRQEPRRRSLGGPQ